ncbi:LOW QUALITY PROTEIN: ribonuclease ZC3H12A [Phyllopteryx taeniolatus]|uniref:LOW QUALITY PROTEIN: ribonuclease ZC3H12A n=1 Tax=Phyllopteryx taeniolatus TaxID=161469 RepID=UPI002AD310E7|nr:LOW QUALITY PROTEIN: ribonuclease ZC3H12A [Phyllopteryx taeniolatus]
MEPAGCTPCPGTPHPSLTPQHLEAELDFFHKLGYSTAQVTAVLKKYGPNTDRNKVLGELVRLRAHMAEQGSVTTESVLVTKSDMQSTELAVRLPLASQSKEEDSDDEDALRPVVVDGSNVAMSHGNKEVFSCMGIQLAVDFFLNRGHTTITVFVPSWRKEQPRPDVPISDQKILLDLEKKKYLTFTPSRRVGHKRVVCNDDLFIVQLAFETGGVIVSNDMYRDLQVDRPEWKDCINERLLMYSFVNDKFMVPDDPLGRHGPNLENFLRWLPKTPKKPQKPCPYGKKCTFGLKCKFLHPERAKQPNCLLADELRENAKLPSTAPKSSVQSPVNGQRHLFVDVASKLTLGHHKSSLKKDKLTHCSRQKSSSKKEKSSLGSSDHGSHKQLDSGIGSIESQSVEAHVQYEPTSCSFHSMLNSHPRSAPCASWRTFQDQHLHHSIRPVRHVSADMMPMDLPSYEIYGEERKVARTKLLAVFRTNLVDAVMDMFPHLVDPEMLAAEIVKMQSDNKMR